MQADGGSHPPVCFHASNRLISSISVICLVMRGASSPSCIGQSIPPMFTGDTLFRHECGRCDLEGGDFSLMLKSLKRLHDLPGDMHVLPGHEGASTLEEERRMNPYMRQAVGK